MRDNISVNNNEGLNLNKSDWTVKRIALIVVLTPLFALFMNAFVSIFVDIFIVNPTPVTSLKEMGERALFLLADLGAIIALTRTYMYMVVPKYFTSMRVVRKYLSHKDLAELLSGEVFIEYYLGEPENKKIIRASKQWICVNGTYIPKSMILGLKRRTPDLLSPNEDRYFTTINGKIIPLGRWGKESSALMRQQLNEIMPDVDFSATFEHLISSGYGRDLKRWFNEAITGKEEFMKFVATGVADQNRPSPGKY